MIDWLVAEPAWTIPAEPVDYTEEEIETLVPVDARIIRQYGVRGASRLSVTGPDGSVDLTLFGDDRFDRCLRTIYSRTGLAKIRF